MLNSRLIIIRLFSSSSQRRYSSVVEHFTRNEGVPGSNPGAAFFIFFSLFCLFRLVNAIQGQDKRMANGCIVALGNWVRFLFYWKTWFFLNWSQRRFSLNFYHLSDEKHCGICRNYFDAICAIGDCNRPGDSCPIIGKGFSPFF